MKILHVTAQSPLRCGIRNFGEQLTIALRRAGAEVDEWDGNYSVIHRKEETRDPSGTYLPTNVADYDVVHVNWHPITTNTYLPEHFDHLGKALLSVYLHDVPPWSGCPFVDRAQARITSEPHPLSTHEMVYPVIDWVRELPPPNAEFTVGWTGIRGDGIEQLTTLCRKQGWAMNVTDPTVWLSLEDEVRRLAKSTVNVCWYKEGRGLSGAASTCLASKRPLIINDSLMLRHLTQFSQVIRAGCLEETLRTSEKVRSDGMQRGWLRTDAADALSWSSAANRLLSHWQEVRRG